MLFLKLEDQRETNSPQIALNWSGYVDTKGLGNRDASSAINAFLATTIGAGYVKKVYRGKRLPRVLLGAKTASALRKTDYFHDFFKTFWEAEGGQV